MNSSFMIIKHFKEIKKKIKIQILKEINFKSWWLRSYTRWDLNLPPFLSSPPLVSTSPTLPLHSSIPTARCLAQRLSRSCPLPDSIFHYKRNI